MGTLRSTLHRVKKTSVYLKQSEVERLAWLSQVEGVPQAEVIRRAIEAYVPAGLGDRNFALLGSFEGDGTSIADVPEEELLRGFGE